MKVLHIIDSLLLGGAEVLLASFVVEAKDEINSDVCTLYSSDTDLNKKIINSGIRLINMNSKRKYSLATLFKLIKLMRCQRYDIVHVHLFPAQYYGAVAALFAWHSKFIFTEHNVHNRRRESRVFKILDSLSYKAYSKIICVGKLVEDNLIKYLPNLKHKTQVITNGIKVDPPKYPNPIIQYDTVLVGSLRSNVKGVDIYLEAIKLAGAAISKAAIAGDGVLKEELIKLRNDLGLQDKVDFLNNVSDIGGLLERSRVFVMPSRFEGLPIALLEAMAKKKPVIASKVGGIPEVIEDGKNGILISPEAPQELAEKMSYLINDPGLCRQMGESAFKTVQERYSIEKYSEKVLNEYRLVVRKPL